MDLRPLVRLALVPLAILSCMAAPAEARQRATFASPASQQINSSTDATFVLAMLREAHEQVAFARLAQRRESAASIAPLALAAGDLWFDAQQQLEAIASDLHVATRMVDAGLHVAALNQLSRTGGAAFNAAYVQTVARANAAALARMESLDARVNARITFFADRFLPRFVGLQNAVQAEVPH